MKKANLILLSSITFLFSGTIIPSRGDELPGTLKWKFPETPSSYFWSDRYSSSPSIGTDGTIYCGINNYLYALNPDGTERWKFEPSGFIIDSSPAVSSDGKIYIAPYILIALNSDGALDWRTQTDKWRIWASPTIGPDSTIYVGSQDKIYNDPVNTYSINAYNPDGTLKWCYATSSSKVYSTAIGSDGRVYAVTYAALYALNKNGRLLFSYKQLYESFVESPAISSDGTIYVQSIDGQNKDCYLNAINPNGTLKWKFRADCTKGYLSSPSIGLDGTIYIGSNSCDPHCLYAINPDGTIKWVFETEDDIPSSPVIGSDGILYIGSWDSYVYAINPDGTLNWKFKTDGHICSSPAIGPDGTVYVNPNSQSLYALYSTSPGISAPAWPMFQHDQYHSANVTDINENANNDFGDGNGGSGGGGGCFISSASK